MKTKVYRSREIARYIFIFLSILFIGTCFIRAITVFAAEKDVEEVYSGEEEESKSEESAFSKIFRASEDDEQFHPEIRLTRPGEGEDRIAYDKGFSKVPGTEHIERAETHERALASQARPKHEDQITVPTKVGSQVSSRRIASDGKEIDLESAIEAGAKANPSSARSAAELKPLGTAAAPNSLPPKPQSFTPVEREHSEDAIARGSQAPSESITSASPKPPRKSFLEGLLTPLRGQDDKNPLPHKPHNPGVQEISVIVSDYGYFPKRIFVTQGIPVKLFLSAAAKNTMCFMMDQWGIRKGVAPGKVEEINFTPDQPGTFRFYCPVKSIEGKITVREVPPAETIDRSVAQAEKNR